MRLNLKSISVLEENAYEVVFEDEANHEVRVVCRVDYDKGIGFVQPSPDIFMDGRADARPIANAVLTFHEARTPPRRHEGKG